MEIGHWDRYAQERPPRRLENAAGARTWFNWTQYPDHGPGLEVLNLRTGSRVLDLGCGKGGNLAHVHSQGHQGTGIDVSAIQLRHARTRWPDLNVVHSDALAYLQRCDEQFDAIYSVFGAIWFIDPEVMLPAVHHRLRGVLAFSYSCLNAVSAFPRWDFEPEEWAEQLEEHGFTEIGHQVIDPPTGLPRGQPTYLVRAVRPA